MTKEEAKELIAFIKSHLPAKVGGFVMEDDQVTKLYVSTLWGVLNGEAVRKHEIIDATFAAAHDWLGY